MTIKYPPPTLVLQQFLQWYHALAIMLFLWASYHQHRCHKILADLRKPATGKKAESPSSSYSPNASKKDTFLSDQKQQLPSEVDENTNTELRKSALEKKSGSPNASEDDPKPQFSRGADGNTNQTNPSYGDLKQQFSRDSSTNQTTPSQPKYGLPTGDWFYYVSCPHLFAEILIYLSLLVCQVWSEAACTWWLVVAHVTCSLFLSARQMHGWYRQKFEDYPKNRTSLFPGLC